MNFNAVMGSGVTFDVRDLVSGVERGNLFEVVRLGTNAADTLTAVQPNRPYYFNGGQGNDTISGGTSNDFLVGGAGNDTLTDDVGNDSFIGGGGNDTITGGSGVDTAFFNVSTDGRDSVNLGTGLDIVNVAAAGAGQIRLSFTSGEVGNNNALDGGTLANQDGGLAVRLQAEDASGALVGEQSRFDDEGIVFVSGTAGSTFDVRDLVTGAQRGNQFEVVVLGTSDAEVLNAVQNDRPYYFNAGQGNDSVNGGSRNDFLVGGAGNDQLRGLGGDDSFIGGGGNDFVSGGRGDDVRHPDGQFCGRDLQLPPQRSVHHPEHGGWPGRVHRRRGVPVRGPHHRQFGREPPRRRPVLPGHVPRRRRGGREPGRALLPVRRRRGT
jgi:Ca2+-binding RTX toxin-like protein